MLLFSVSLLNAGSGSKTLWDMVRSESQKRNLDPQLVFIENPNYTFMGNQDYEVLIDVMMATLETAKLPKTPMWYDGKMFLFTTGVLTGIFITK